ncbi:HPr family phosphocarrier protein [bacterium]|nr:HPr family phosphocarrier protein [bacterium]
MTGDANGVETVSRDVQLINKYGLHARPATLIAQSAKTFKSEVVLIKGDEKVDAKSIFNLMTLAAEKGAKLTIRATGIDAKAAVDKIAALVEARFNEDD